MFFLYCVVDFKFDYVMLIVFFGFCIFKIIIRNIFLGINEVIFIYRIIIKFWSKFVFLNVYFGYFIYLYDFNYYFNKDNL